MTHMVEKVCTRGVDYPAIDIGASEFQKDCQKVGPDFS